MNDRLPAEHELLKLSETTLSYKYQDSIPFDEWQKKSREKLKELLGLPLESCDSDIQIESESSEKFFREIRFKFQSEPGYYVPCVLRIPAGATKPLPVVICLQGHSTGMHISLGIAKYPNDAESIKSGDRDFANRVIEEGFCALAIEQRGMGSRGGDETGPQCHVPAMTSLLIGRTMIGQRVWDISRAIDVLEKHFPQVDHERIICLGNSGGGTSTFYASCLDERISLSVPSCSVCTYKDSIASIKHCVCNFIPHIHEYFDMGDLAGLIAPRPLIVVAGKDDPIFPIHGVKKAFEDIKKMYSKSSSPNNCRLVIGDGGHRFYADDAWNTINDIIDYDRATNF